MPKIEIDQGSGFCFGVVNAIRQAEEQLTGKEKLYCLGDIVHNGQEVNRLEGKGLKTIDHNQYNDLHDATVLLRAHGEPPITYFTALKNNIKIVDATCPVVLQLQKKIKLCYQNEKSINPQIIIFGKKGHAEVNGLVGQTEGSAIVIEGSDDLDKLDYSRPIRLYAQTTKSIEGFKRIVEEINKRINPGVSFLHFDTICRQVSNRIPNIANFATKHDLILFVSGKKSSNGKVLFEQCLKANPNSRFISDESDLEAEWFEGVESIGICGATSTPKWLMEKVQKHIEKILIQ